MAAAVDRLEKSPGVRRRTGRAAGRAVELFSGGNVPGGAVFEEGAAAPGGTPVTAYVFPEMADREVLRRLTQMPDETPLDLLMRPFAVYCPEMKSFVSVNDPETSLEQHIRKLTG